MKRIIVATFALFAVLGFTTASFAVTAQIGDESKLVATAATTLEGTLMKIEGDFYVIMDSTGKQQRVHVDKSTAMIGKVTPGAKVKAEVSDGGHASAVKSLGK